MDADIHLLKRAKAGDVVALDELLSSYDERLRRLIRHLARREEDVEELLQESRLRAWHGFGSFNGDASFATWYFTIPPHVAVDYYRGQRRRAQRLAKLKWFTEGQTACSVAGLCEQREDLKRCLRCIITFLPLEQQIAALLCEVSEVGDAAAAKDLGKSVRDFQRVLHEARATLHSCCGGNCRVVAKTGMPKDFPLPSPANLPVRPQALRRAGRPPSRLIKRRDQLVRELLFFDADEAERLIANARNR